MRYYTFNYYKKFNCIAEKCKHNCCKNWVIDIDEKTKARYLSLPSNNPLFNEIKCCVDSKNNCFLMENKACKLLDKNGLCAIQKSLGQSGLCEVCKNHPRFRNYFNGVEELGLGLACEEVSRIILSEKEKTSLILIKEGKRNAPLSNWDKEIIEFRKKVLSIAQNREFSLEKRLSLIGEFIGFNVFNEKISFWKEKLSSFERLEDDWENKLNLLNENNKKSTTFDLPFEQILVYFIYRHLPCAFDKRDLYSKTAFSLISTYIIITMYNNKVKDEAFNLEELIEIARAYSVEIEYSQENLFKMFDVLDSKVVL